MSVSNMWLGDLKNYSAERIAGKGQLLPHASMVLRGRTAKPVLENLLFNPFPDPLRILQGDENDLCHIREESYLNYFPGGIDPVPPSWTFVLLC
jgi:hypothetical protein